MNKFLILMLLGLLLSSVSALRFLQEEDAQGEDGSGSENNPETGAAEENQGASDEEVDGGQSDGQSTNQPTCNCEGGSHDGHEQVCGETEEIHSAWVTARDTAREDNKGVKDTILQVLTAVKNAGADESTAVCVTFVAGVSTGADTCDLIDQIVKQLVSSGASDETAEAVVEEAAKKRYTWYSGYSQFCGERPDYSAQEEEETTEEQEDEGQEEEVNTGEEIISVETEYLCGETEEVHKAWTEAKKKAEESGANDGEIFQAASLAAIEAGADDETANCISFVSGDDTKIPLCELINWVNAWWIRRLLPMETIEGWTDEAVRKVYPCYDTYANFCGERPFYALDTGTVEEEVTISETNSEAAESTSP